MIKPRAEALSELRRVVAEMTPGEWQYKPHEFDDWGTIRTSVTPGFFVARSYGNGPRDDDAAHRRAGTDPYEPNGRAIVAAVRLLRAVVEPDDAVVERVARELFRRAAMPAGSKEQLDRLWEVTGSERYLDDARFVLATIAALGAE